MRSIDIQNSKHLYLQLTDILENQIREKKLNPNDRIPTIRELALSYNVSQKTAVNAINELVKSGLLYCRRKRGTFVAQSTDSWKSQRSAMLGVIIPDITRPFYPEIIKGIEDIVHKRGYEINLSNSDDKLKKETSAIKRLSKRGVDGLIIAPAQENGSNVKLFREMKLKKIPFLFIDRYLKEVRADFVVTDNLLGAYLATKHLIHKGHKKIGCLVSSRKVMVFEDKVEGYKKALMEEGMQVQFGLIKRPKNSNGAVYDAAVKLIKRENPTALFISSYYYALEILKAIKKQGLKIPKDITLAGFDDLHIPLSEQRDLSLETFFEGGLIKVIQPQYEIGKVAAETLLEKIEGKEPERKKIKLKPELIIT